MNKNQDGLSGRGLGLRPHVQIQAVLALGGAQLLSERLDDLRSLRGETGEIERRRADISGAVPAKSLVMTLSRLDWAKRIAHTGSVREVKGQFQSWLSSRQWLNIHRLSQEPSHLTCTPPGQQNADHRWGTAHTEYPDTQKPWIPQGRHGPRSVHCWLRHGHRRIGHKRLGPMSGGKQLAGRPTRRISKIPPWLTKKLFRDVLEIKPGKGGW